MENNNAPRNNNYNNRNNDNKFNPQNRKFKPFRKKYCKFCSEGVVWIDYKNLDRLEQYVTDKGKIVSAKITGTCARHQRQLATAIKVLRNLALMPYTATNYKPRIPRKTYNPNYVKPGQGTQETPVVSEQE